MTARPALAALRVAATLTHSLPRLRARVRAGDRIVLDVFTPGEGEVVLPRVEDRRMSPCRFRTAVGAAFARSERSGASGPMLPFLDLPELAVDIATPSVGAARPGGIYRCPLEGRWLWAFATTLDAETAFDLGRDVVGETALPEVRTFGIRPDPVTEVSLAFAETTSAPGSREELALLDVLEALLARWTAHDLVSVSREPARSGRWSGGAGAGSPRAHPDGR